MMKTKCEDGECGECEWCREEAVKLLTALELAQHLEDFSRQFVAETRGLLRSAAAYIKRHEGDNKSARLQIAEDRYLEGAGWKTTIAVDTFVVSEQVASLLGLHPQALWERHEALSIQKTLDRWSYRGESEKGREAKGSEIRGIKNSG